ncbi:MAG: glycosyltransferase [Candidatus Cloacimonadales bacterium]|jgi:glycosyltransferase involved in cell wall biosynthesis|nr:glycosyltransferase [Candidatus Cloacimonadota bacterium]MDD2650381.1 glycosyltransferase [Candidatus Cloacimonadota bacterium]MDX9976869.1 glycosyltransferase [Candidatus Cloacimonadales bacterium]
MKIAFIGPAFPLRGGIAEFMMNTINKAAKRDHDIKIFSFLKQYPRLLFPGKNQFNESKHQDNYPTKRTFVPYNPFTWKKGINEVLEYEPDLVVIKYWIPFFAPLYTYIINKIHSKSKAKVMYIIHNIHFHERWPFGKILSQTALKRADYLLSLSESVYQSILDIMPAFPKQNIIKAFHPNYEVTALNEQEKHNAYFDLKISPKKTILFFGYIKPYKGLDVLIRAFKEVNEQTKDIQLVIAGEVYGSDQHYTKLIKENNLEEFVVFHNFFVKDEDIPKYFAIADVVVQPYRSATQSGVSLLALSYGKPVISTKTGALDEIIIPNKNGILVAPEDEDALSRAIIDFFNKYDRESMVQFIQYAIENYSWDSFIDIMLKPFK